MGMVCIVEQVCRTAWMAVVCIRGRTALVGMTRVKGKIEEQMKGSSAQEDRPALAGNMQDMKTDMNR